MISRQAMVRGNEYPDQGWQGEKMAFPVARFRNSHNAVTRPCVLGGCWTPWKVALPPKHPISSLLKWELDQVNFSLNLIKRTL